MRVPKSRAERSWESPSRADQRASGSESARIYVCGKCEGALLRGVEGGTHLVLEPEEAGPAGEHEGVVGGNDGDDIDALRLEFVNLLEVGREVVRVARWLQRPQCASVQRRSIAIRGRTVKAPGTAKMTTFLPFHASVVNFEAA